MKALDVGCGPNCLPGADGIDLYPAPGVKFVHDLNIVPLQIADNTYEFVRCMHNIEHVRELHSMAKELARVCKSGTRIEFITPHYSSYASYGDPTHLHHFARASIPLLFEQSIGVNGFRVIKNEIRFSGAVIDLFGWLINKLSPKKYEKHFAWIFPANEIHTTIEIVKQN